MLIDPYSSKLLNAQQLDQEAGAICEVGAGFGSTLRTVCSTRELFKQYHSGGAYSMFKFQKY